MTEQPAEVNELRERLAEAERRADLLETLRTSEQLSTVARLASTIAHELGTPLNVISGRATMIASGEIAGEEGVASAKVVVEQANRMAAIIRQILGYLRKQTSTKVPVGLADIFAQAIIVVSPRANQRGVLVRVDPKSEPIVVKVDPGKFLQVVAYLLNRAIGASPRDGTVTVGVRMEKSTPTDDQLRRSHDCYVISFTDHGAAIPAEALPSLFKPFFHSERDPDGTALGMSIIHGIVREVGGWLKVDNDPAAGNTFKVYLPDIVVRQAIERRPSSPGEP
jgi:signal transduction histidine kinase